MELDIDKKISSLAQNIANFTKTSI